MCTVLETHNSFSTNKWFIVILWFYWHNIVANHWRQLVLMGFQNVLLVTLIELSISINFLIWCIWSSVFQYNYKVWTTLIMHHLWHLRERATIIDPLHVQRKICKLPLEYVMHKTWWHLYESCPAHLLTVYRLLCVIIFCCHAANSIIQAAILLLVVKQSCRWLMLNQHAATFASKVDGWDSQLYSCLAVVYTFQC